MAVKKSVDVSVYGNIDVTVICDECGEMLAIKSVENEGKYHEDEIIVVVVPHTCPKEEETSA
jgi:formylmethanofuran dehydrogenase subunit E